jgi:hypothetical protein
MKDTWPQRSPRLFTRIPAWVPEGEHAGHVFKKNTEVGALARGKAATFKTFTQLVLPTLKTPHAVYGSKGNSIAPLLYIGLYATSFEDIERDGFYAVAKQTKGGTLFTVSVDSERIVARWNWRPMSEEDELLPAGMDPARLLYRRTPPKRPVNSEA